MLTELVSFYEWYYYAIHVFVSDWLLAIVCNEVFSTLSDIFEL